MLLHSEAAERLARIEDRLVAADAPTVSLISAIALEACDRRVENAGHISAQIGKLTDAHAWTDAALALIVNESPRWKLRRLAYDEGEWHCALCLQPDLPEWLDQSIETSHANLPLALLEAFVEAKRRDSETADESGSPTVPRIQAETRDLICCDNFL